MRGGNAGESEERGGPLRDCGATAVLRPPRARGKRRGRGEERRKGTEESEIAKGFWSGADLSHRFPGERRDPGTTERWVATRRTSNYHSLRSTERAVFQESSIIVPAESPPR